MADIFYNGKIYVGVVPSYPESDYEVLEHTQYKSYLVSGSHSFTDGSDVTGLFKLDFQYRNFLDKDFISVKQLDWLDAKDESRKRIVAIPLPPAVEGIEGEAKEFFLPPDEGEGWNEGAKTFTRKEVFNLLYTQRAMIINDIKRECNLDNQPLLLDILKNPRIPKF